MIKTAVTTLEKVGVNDKSLEAYQTIVGDEVIDEIKLVSRNLRGAIHLRPQAVLACPRTQASTKKHVAPKPLVFKDNILPGEKISAFQ
jgi:hypothetical protein